ncbi:MAG: MarR family transcriptional regulator [Acidimicrobiales bacterium]
MPDTIAIDELAGDLRLVIGRIARRLRQDSSGGLSPSQLSALSTLGDRGAIRLSELAAVERVSPPTLTKIVASLESQGLVRRQGDPVDRRASLVRATPAGQAILRRIRGQRTAMLTRLLADLPAADVERLREALPVLVQLAEADK